MNEVAAERNDKNESDEARPLGWTAEVISTMQPPGCLDRSSIVVYKPRPLQDDRAIP